MSDKRIIVLAVTGAVCFLAAAIPITLWSLQPPPQKVAGSGQFSAAKLPEPQQSKSSLRPSETQLQPQSKPHPPRGNLLGQQSEPKTSTAHAQPPQPAPPRPSQSLPATRAAPVPIMPPKPFRDVRWGELLEGRDDMTLDRFQPETVSVTLDNNRPVDIKNLHVKNYRRDNDKLQFGPEPVGGIEYSAFDGRFYRVNIVNLNPFTLSTVFSQVYGPPKEFEIGKSHHWSWDADNGQTTITMFYGPPDSIFPNGISGAQIENMKLAEELATLQKAEAREQLQKAKKDF